MHMGRFSEIIWATINKFASVVACRADLLLLLTFLIMVLIRSFISLKFESPWIFRDEMIYAKMAENVLSHAYSEYPPLYPLSLSAAYLFSTDKSTIYHIMLLITSVINASALFPSYFILRKYCSENYSLVGSIAIASLPCLVLYNFSLMCENLLIPLFIFSIWFLLEACRTRAKFWIAVTVLSVLFLFFTKHSGFSMAFGLAVSGIYYVSLDLKYDRIHPPSKKIILFKYILPSVALLSIASLLIYRTFFLSQTFSEYIRYQSSRLEFYSNNFVDIFFNIASLKEFLILFLHELEYLMISSYFVVFLAAGIFFIFVFNITRGVSLKALDYSNLAELRGDKALKSSIIYFIFSGIALIIAVVSEMYNILGILSEGYSYQFMYSRDDFQLIGRYIVPLVPAIFLFGLIGLYMLQGQKNPNRFKIISAFIVVYLATCSLFALTFPFDLGKDVFPILYLRSLESLMPAWAIVPSIMSPFLIACYLSLYDRRALYVLLSLIIVFSAIISAQFLPYEIAASKGFKDQNQIGFYLENLSDDSSLILMDQEDDTRDWVMMPFTQFWARGTVVTYSTAADPSGVYTDYTRNVSYIISSKILPYEPVAYSTRGYILYKSENFKDNRSLYAFDKPERWHNLELRPLPTLGFYGPEFYSGIQTRWIQSNAAIGAFSSDNCTAILSMQAQSFYRPRTLEVFVGDELAGTTAVTASFNEVTMPVRLVKGANTVRLHVAEGCERPYDIKELNNYDQRCLSIAIQNISITKVNTTAPIVSPSGGFHALESWSGIRTRWMQANATLNVFSSDNRTAILSMRALSFYRPRTLEVFVGDEPAGTAAVATGFKELKMPVRLVKGANTVRLHVPEGCERPCDIKELNSSDCKCLSLAVQDLNATG